MSNYSFMFYQSVLHGRSQRFGSKRLVNPMVSCRPSPSTMPRRMAPRPRISDPHQGSSAARQLLLAGETQRRTLKGWSKKDLHGRGGIGLRWIAVSNTCFCCSLFFELELWQLSYSSLLLFVQESCEPPIRIDLNFCRISLMCYHVNPFFSIPGKDVLSCSSQRWREIYPNHFHLPGGSFLA